MSKYRTDVYENFLTEDTLSEPISIQTSTDIHADVFPMDNQQAMSVPPGYTGTDVPEQAKEKASVGSRFKTIATTFEEVSKTAVFPDNFLIINDVILSDIPTAAVKFISSDGVFIAETLRTSAPVVTPNNAQTLSVQLSLIFNSTEESMTKLRRLVSVLTIHPLVYLYNNKIRKNLGVKHDETTIFILDHGTVRSAPDAVGSLVLDLTLHYFNYKPFSNHFWYNANMPDGKTSDERIQEARALPYNNQSLGDLTGYEASSHSIQQEAEGLIREMKIGTYKIGNDAKLSQNQPIPFPAASDTWMYYANHLFRKSNTLSKESSDYIGFEMKEYEQISPPKGAQAGGGNPRKLINEDGFPSYSQFFDAKKNATEALLSKTASERKADAYAGDDREAVGTGAIKIYCPDNNKRINFDPSDSKSTALLSEWSTSKKIKDKLRLQNITVSLSPETRWILVDVQLLFPGKTISVLKSIGAGTGPHGRGEAIDLKVSGVDAEEVFYKMREVYGWGDKKGGAGYYPKSKFCHFDIGKARNWIDVSGPGEDQSPLDRIAKERELNEIGLRQTQVNGVTVSDSYSSADTFDNAVKASKEIGFQTVAISEETEEAELRNLLSRTTWIRDMQDLNDLRYYWGDSKLRNIFYRTIQANVASELDAQRSGTALKNLVCSGLSLNFGHRIVPQRLVGQDTCTWQFLGSGNKSGTIGLTFAGEEGRRSADELKSMFHRARINAKLYGAIIPDAGTIKINRIDPHSSKINNIFSLLDVNHIVISDINESSVPGSPDKHELVVDFISQDFTKEGLEKRFLSQVDSKKRMIASLLKFVKAETLNDKTISERDGVKYSWKNSYLGETRDNRHIKPNPNIIERTNSTRVGANGYTPQPFRIKNSDFPAWLAEIIIDTARICNKLNSEMPPSTWRLNTTRTRTWKDRYSEVGAEEIMFGQVINIDATERNGYVEERISNPYSTTVPDMYEIQGQNPKMYNGIFDNNGAKHTNKVHSRIYNRFLDQMDILIQRAKKYMIADKKNFDKYFGSISDELMKAATASIGDCYQDMDMPLVPGGDLPMPPEFYVFNDADEDPALSSLTDDYNMEAYLLKHIKNEKASIKHYLKDVYLGGSYLSQNMPKILRERADYVTQFEALKSEQTGEIGEYDFLQPKRMLGEGVKTWEPLYYNEKELTRSGDGKTDSLAWKENIDSKYNESLFPSSPDKIRTKYMDNIISLSPYLKHGRGQLWSRGEDTSSNVEIIESVYDENWKRIAFGPNPDNATADENLAGYLATPETKRKRESQKLTMAKAKAKAENKSVLVRGAEDTVRTILPDGSVMIGGNEKMEAEASHNALEAAGIAVDPKNIAKEWEAKKEAYRKQWLQKRGKKRDEMTDVDIYAFIADWEQKRFSFKVYEPKADLDDFANIAMSLPSHEALASKFKDGDEDKDLAKMVKGIAFGTKAQDLSIRRAYPTFKIYFIEEDSQETEKIDGHVLRAFDDFYSYSSIQEIKITRSRKVAGDIAVIRMTNVGGKLLRKRYGDKDPLSVAGETALRYGVGAEYATGFFADTEKENPFEKMILQDGVKTQIRLGYANDPDLLESCFLGQIVEIAPKENGRIIEIVCQGYGAELESVELGPLEDGPAFYSTQQVLSAAIIQDSIVNFGRRSKFNKFNAAEGRHAFTGGLGKGLASQSIDDLIHKWGDDNLYQQFYKHQFLNYPQDDNIYAPPPKVYATTWMRFWNNACVYRPLSQTPWEIFKEHELRHPGYVSLAVPYGHSPRMTMFFGAKGQHYWNGPPSNKELFLSDTLADNVVAGRGLSARALRENPFLANQMMELAKVNPSIAKAVLLDLSHYGAPISVGKAVGELFGRYVPFRNYHFFDAAHHILKNEIKTSKDGVFNEIELLFFENENDITEDDSEKLAENVEVLVRKEAGHLACKLDDNLPQEHIRSYTKEFPSCNTSDMAKRYIQGLFARHLRDSYKGDLIVLGEAKLKPYDICYLNDTSINMTGPIEVESVTHIFNRDHGFISIVTPDLCIDINDYYSATVFDIAGAAHAAMRFDSLSSVPVLASVASDISFLGLSASVKFMQWTQDGVPVISTPLTLGGKPFQSIAMGMKNASLFYTWGGRWNQHWDDVKSGWQKFDLSETLLDTQRSWQESVNTFMSRSKGAGYSLDKS